MSPGWIMTIVRVASVGAAAMSLPAPSARAAEAPRALGCEGPFAKAGDEAALVARFGRTNVVSTTLAGAEGSTERGTVVFPKDPARRIEIVWHDPDHRRRPASITIKGRARWLVRPSETALPSIGLGTSLEKVETANGRPFTIIGFGWDMGGYAGGWRGGILEGERRRCNLSLRFDPSPKAAAKALDTVSGDRRFSSADRAVRAVAPTVSEIALGWPE